MRRLLHLARLVFLFSLRASAQTIHLFAGYTFVHTSPCLALSAFNANGGVASSAPNLASWGSVVVEGSGILVSTNQVNWNKLPFAAGVIFRF
jgi:hypothetical protein